MAYEIDTYVGKIYYSECGMITEDDIYSVEDWEEMLEDKEFKLFTRAELFWKIHDWLVRPTRDNFMDAYPDGDIGSLRLYRIEDLENNLTCYFHIDSLDNLSVEINLNSIFNLQQAVEEIAEKMREAIIDDDEIRSFICTDCSNDLDIPYGESSVRERMMDEVFHPDWL